MSEGPKPDKEVLHDREVAELLARASELDVQRATGSQVDDLRSAATQAGISASSFDTALAQMREERSELPVVPAPKNKRTRAGFFAVSLIVAVLGGLLLLSCATSTTAGAR